MPLKKLKYPIVTNVKYEYNLPKYKYMQYQGAEEFLNDGKLREIAWLLEN